MTTSILNFEKLKEQMPAELAAGLPATSPALDPHKSVTMKEFLERAQSLFTSEEADDLARRVEEGRAQAHD